MKFVKGVMLDRKTIGILFVTTIIGDPRNTRKNRYWFGIVVFSTSTRILTMFYCIMVVRL